MENLFVFDHEKESLYEALGFNSEFDDRCREIVFFATISNHLIGADLFETPEETPRRLTTITGDLEKSLSLATDSEKQYLLVIFKHMHRIAIESIGKWRAFNKMVKGEKAKLDLIFKLMEIKAKEDMEKEGESEENYLSTLQMSARIELVQKNLFSFEDYFKKAQENNLVKITPLSRRKQSKVDDFLDDLLDRMKSDD